ncbi:5-oxoprolinase subunit C family protein [Lutibacter sp.]
MLKVLQPGLHTSIQDVGRFGFRNIGVPSSGVMDSISADFANALLNNPKNSAVLEIAMHGPKLEFIVPTTIVISGAEISAKLNNKAISNYKLYSVKSGTILSFGKLQKGLHCYVAVKGGFQTKKILKSRSFYKGITSQGFVKKNDRIPYNKEIANFIKGNSVINNKKQFFETTILEVYKGPEFELFTKNEQKLVLSNVHTVSNQINRMGYRLKETYIPHHKTIITSPVLPGTVQVVPTGQLIVLMKDAQTTGGYPRIFQLTEKSIAILAQKKEGDSFKFKLIN